MDTDINTLGELTKERFDLDACREFFEMAANTDKDVVNNIEEIVNVD